MHRTLERTCHRVAPYLECRTVIVSAIFGTISRLQCFECQHCFRGQRHVTPLAVLGFWQVCDSILQIMCSQRRLTISPRRIAVSTASWMIVGRIMEPVAAMTRSNFVRRTAAGVLASIVIGLDKHFSVHLCARSAAAVQTDRAQAARLPPETGSRERYPLLRSWQSVIFFVAWASEVTVVRILHGARDLTAPFHGDDKV